MEGTRRVAPQTIDGQQLQEPPRSVHVICANSGLLNALAVTLQSRASQAQAKQCEGRLPESPAGVAATGDAGLGTDAPWAAVAF